MKKLIFVGLAVLLLAFPVYAQQSQKTGLDVVIESYGFTLVDYDVTNKFKFDEEKFTALEIIIEKDNIQYNLYWIMKKERYNELREKI